MGWDKKGRGPATGYFYVSRRTAAGVAKVYMGRGAAAQTAAAAHEHRQRVRQAGRDAVRSEAAATAEADRLAAELHDWAALLTRAWMTASGHHLHRGQWRRRRD